MDKGKTTMTYDLTTETINIQYQNVEKNLLADVLWLDKDEWEQLKNKIDGLFIKEEA